MDQQLTDILNDLNDGSITVEQAKALIKALYENPASAQAFDEGTKPPTVPDKPPGSN